MKKTLNINLGGLAFIIDENAYELLNNYLEALKAKFSDASERDEILKDIEARMAEMLSQRMSDRREIVGVEDITKIISIMGQPEVIAGEKTEEDSSSQNTSSSYVYETPIKRRLFRDPDDAKVAGVISGLCHYFGINDPTWVRLAIVLLCFVSFGTVLLVYILLAIVIPKAQTSSEKLQMKGEPVNISTIEKEIKSAVNRAGESVNKFVREETFFEKLWGAFLTITKGILKLIAGVIIVCGLLIIFALVAALFGVSFAGNALLAHAPHLLVDDTFALSYLKFGLVLFIGAPVLGLIYAALRLIFGRQTQAPMLKWILIAVWWIGVFLIAYGGYGIAREFSARATKNEEIVLMQPANGTLFFQLTDSLGNRVSQDEDESENYNINIRPGGVFINDISIDEMERIPIGEPSLQLMPSSNDSFYIQKSIATRGKNKGDALTNSGYVVYNISQTDTVVNLPAYLELDKHGKFRDQKIKIRLAIPEGKFVSFADNIDRWAATVKGDASYDDTYFANTIWTTENGRIKCVKGENHSHAWDEEEIETRIEEKTKRLEEKIDQTEKRLKEKEKELTEKGKKLQNRVDKQNTDESDQDF